MRIFITGGTGFLGVNLIKGLVLSGYEVIALIRNNNERLTSINPKVTIIKGSLEALDLIDCPNFDICIHLAWSGVNREGVSSKKLQQKNIDYSLNILNFAYKHRCSLFIDSGSRQEYSPTNNLLDEDSPCKPISEYGKWKLEAYNQLLSKSKEYNIQYIHFRIFSIYGIGDHPWSLINTLITSLLKNKDVQLGTCTQQWSFLYIDDFVEAIIQTLKHRTILNKSEVFNLGSKDVRPLHSFINQVYDLCHSHSRLLYGEFKQNPESIFSIIPNISKIERKIDWQEKFSFKVGIQNIIKNYSS
jgi:hypothetical protein